MYLNLPGIRFTPIVILSECVIGNQFNAGILKTFKPSIINESKAQLNYFMTNFDFDLFLKDGTSKVVKYGELDEKYTTFEQLLPNTKDYVIILIESQVNTGHWVCIIRNDNVFEYFDPYGYTHKKTLSFISDYMNKHVLDNTLSD